MHEGFAICSQLQGFDCLKQQAGPAILCDNVSKQQ